MAHEPEEHDPPWTTDEDAAAVRRREEVTEESAYVGRHGIRHPQEGLGIGNAPLDDPFGDSTEDDNAGHAFAGHQVQGGGTQGERPVRRFNEADSREGPAWADQPDGGGVRRHRADTGSDASAPTNGPTTTAGSAPVEEITPEDLPEVGEPYAQPGAPFEVQGPDRP